MAKQSGTGRVARKGATGKGGGAAKSAARHRSALAKRSTKAQSTRVEAVMAAAERSGLLQGKNGRIGGRVSPALVERAKARTGIATDTELIAFALANVALEDKFAETFKAVGGTVDPDLKLGF